MDLLFGFCTIITILSVVIKSTIKVLERDAAWMFTGSVRYDIFSASLGLLVCKHDLADKESPARQFTIFVSIEGGGLENKRRFQEHSLEQQGNGSFMFGGS